METEIICISSDDESDSQKENRKKTTLTNSAEKNNTSLAHAKAEILSNDDEKVEGNSLKRKISQVDEDRSSTSNNTEKKQKLSNSSTSQDLSKVDKDSIAIVDMLRSNKAWEVRVEKPKLVVKERKKISYIGHDLFPLFISLCLQKCHDTEKKDMEKIVDKLKHRYEELDPVYVSSEDFASFLNEKREAIMNNDKKLYVYIEEVMNEMKRSKKSQIPQNSESYIAVPSTSYAANNLSLNTVVELDYEDDENVEDEERSLETRRKLKKLLKAMRKCELAIKKLEEAEVDFDDEGNSNYIKVERYKQRMVELYNKLCEFTGENADAERAYLRPKHISATRIVAVDQAITNFINSKISKQNQLRKSGTFTDDLIFPDCRDILECVSKCNDKKNLGLDKRKQEQMAKKAFVEVGEYLQRARRNDYWDTFSLYLENAEEDPAMKDKELAKKLSDNCSEGEKRLAAVFEKYTKKQEEMKLQCLNDQTTTDEENEEESSIDEEDEDKDYLSIHDSSEEDNGSENDVDETIHETKEDGSFLKKNENNINTVNADQRTDEVILSKTKTDMQEKHNNKVKIKSAKGNDVTVQFSERENKIASELKTRGTIISNTFIATKSINGIDMKTQEDILSSTTNCTSTINRIEEDVPEVITDSTAEVVTGNEAEMITGNAAKAKTGNAAKAITDNAVKAIMGNVAKVITGSAEVIIGNAAEVMMGDVAEVIVDDVTEVIVDDIVETVTEDVAETAMGDVAEVATGDVAEMATGDVAEMATGNVSGVITRDIVESTTRNISKLKLQELTMQRGATNVIITKKATQMAMKDLPTNKQSEEEKKPLLRVRSFAKPPTTWEDGRHKTDKSSQGNVPKEINQTKDVIDLTNESNVNKSVPITKCAIQLGNKVVPLVKAKQQTLVIPPGSNIISVQNITNNYLKVDTRTGQILSPVRNVCVPTIIRVPSAQTTATQQNQPQNVNVATTRGEASSKRNEAILRIIQPNKAIVAKKLTGQVISKQVNVHSSSKPK